MEPRLPAERRQPRLLTWRGKSLAWFWSFVAERSAQRWRLQAVMAGYQPASQEITKQLKKRRCHRRAACQAAPQRNRRGARGGQDLVILSHSSILASALPRWLTRNFSSAVASANVRPNGS